MAERKSDTNVVLNNLSPVEFYPYAVFNPVRRVFRRYAQLSHAKSALAGIKQTFYPVRSTDEYFEWVGSLDSGSWEPVKEED
jgi:hypothetical protein